MVEEEEIQAGVEVAASDGDEAVERLLRFGGRVIEGSFLAGIGVAEILQGSTVGRIVIPDGKLEQRSSQKQQELGLVALFDRRLSHVSALGVAT